MTRREGARTRRRCRARDIRPGRQPLMPRAVAHTAPSESTLPLSRRSELIGKISADAGLMGNDHILPLRTEDGLVQRRAPALGQHIYAPG